MLKEIITKCSNINLIREGNKEDGSLLKSDFLELLESSYFAPSYITADNEVLENMTKFGIWMEFDFNKQQCFKDDYPFSKLLVSIKPRQNWITLYRYFDGSYQGKCINLNLATKTTKIFKKIKAFKGSNKFEK